MVNIRVLLLLLFFAISLSAQGKGNDQGSNVTDEKTAEGRMGVEIRTENPGAIVFRTGLVIEGKVEKPQVQFTLTKEQPPDIKLEFNESFIEEVLKWERNTLVD